MYCTSLQGNTYVMNPFHLHRKHLYIFNHVHLEKSTVKLRHSPSFSYAFQRPTLILIQHGFFLPDTTQKNKKVIPNFLFTLVPFIHFGLSTFGYQTVIHLYLFEVIHMWIKNIRFNLAKKAGHCIRFNVKVYKILRKV